MTHNYTAKTHPPPSTLHAARCTLHAARCTLHVTTATLHAARCTLHAAPYTLHLYLRSEVFGKSRNINSSFAITLLLWPSLVDAYGPAGHRCQVRGQDAGAGVRADLQVCRREKSIDQNALQRNRSRSIQHCIRRMYAGAQVSIRTLCGQSRWLHKPLSATATTTEQD